MRRAIALLWLVVASQAFAAFGYYSPISINAAQVPGTETDFPVLVLQTDNRFKTVANGGHVQDAQGDDIRPYTDSGLGTAITGYEKVFYDGTTGTIEMWVKVSSLTSSSTPFVLAYGDSSITTDGSSTTTWSNSFLGVYHLSTADSANWGTFVTSSTGSNNGASTGASATTGQINGAASFPSGQLIAVGTGMNPTAITLSAWINATSFAHTNNIIIGRANNTYTSYALLAVKSTGKLHCLVMASSNREYDATGSHTLSTGTWYYITMTYDSSAGLVGYVDAGSDNTVAANGALNTTVVGTRIASDPGSPGASEWTGKIDEPRISSVVRSANWITTEYNNQVAPGTFETLGTEVAVTTSGNTNFFMFFP